MNGSLIWLDVDEDHLDQTIRHAQRAIRRGANRWRTVLVAHAELRQAAPTPCLAAISIGIFDAEMDEEEAA